MDCKQTGDLMSAYIDNELESSDSVRVAAHIAGCNACASASEDALGLRAIMKEHATVHRAPDHLRHRIQTAIDQEKSKDAARNKKKQSWAWINFGLATAFSCVFALTLTRYLAFPSESDRFDQELIADHYRSLMVDHLTDVASSDHHTVKPWFTGKLDFSPPVVDLKQQGFPLVGGRLDYLDGRPAAALAYRHEQHLINLFVLPDKAIANAAVESRSKQGFQLVHWVRSGMAYWAVSDTSAQTLLAFQRTLAAQPE